MDIEKQPIGYHATYELSEQNWFLVQTNYDVGEDSGDDDRKTPAIKRLEAIGK